MNSPLIQALIATFLISLISLIGILTLVLKEKSLQKILFFFVSFSAGSLMGGAFFHLIPESLENSPASTVFKFTITGFIIFFILEKILHWHHCQNQHCEEHKILGFQNLFGDALHNFIDGIIIVTAFLVDINLGIATALSVAFHEIPQEISDFGVLIYSGFSRSKAIFYNLVSAFFAVIGALFGYLLISNVEQISQWLIPITAGGFIYISASDLIPEINKERNPLKSFLSLFFFILALIFLRII